MRAHKTTEYIRIEYNGRGTSYPVSRYTPRTAWADFWRTLRVWREAATE